MVLSEASQVVGGFLSPAIAIVSNTIIATFLARAALSRQPDFGAWRSRRHRHDLCRHFSSPCDAGCCDSAKRASKPISERSEAASEVFGGIKEIKLLGNENAYLKRFSTAFSRVARAQANSKPRWRVAGLRSGADRRWGRAHGGALLSCAAAGALTRTLTADCALPTCARGACFRPCRISSRR